MIGLLLRCLPYRARFWVRRQVKALRAEMNLPCRCDFDSSYLGSKCDWCGGYDTTHNDGGRA